MFLPYLYLHLTCVLPLQTDEGYTSLYSASERGDLEVVQLLVFNNANVNIEEQKGLIPLHLACFNGHRKVTFPNVYTGCDDYD